MDVTAVKANIVAIYERRRAAVYALCLSYAARALDRFRANQAEQLYWQNQTGQAYARVFATGYIEESVVGWFMAHGVQYGVYLELANDRKHEALRPVMESLIPQFMSDLREIYGLGIFQL
jgi:hypothetical protein